MTIFKLSALLTSRHPCDRLKDHYPLECCLHKQAPLLHVPSRWKQCKSQCIFRNVSNDKNSLKNSWTVVIRKGVDLHLYIAQRGQGVHKEMAPWVIKGQVGHKLQRGSSHLLESENTEDVFLLGGEHAQIYRFILLDFTASEIFFVKVYHLSILDIYSQKNKLLAKGALSEWMVRLSFEPLLWDPPNHIKVWSLWGMQFEQWADVFWWLCCPHIPCDHMQPEE